MCRTPWQPPLAPILVATTSVFPLPVPQGFKVVGQDAEGCWSFEKDHARSDQPPPSFRHRLLYSPSCSPNFSSSSLLSKPPTARLSKRSRVCVNRGAEKEVDLVTDTHFADNLIPSAPLLSLSSFSSATGPSKSLDRGNSSKDTKSVGTARHSSNYVVVGIGVVIEELAVSRDEVDGFEISAFASEFSEKRQCRSLNQNRNLLCFRT